MKKFRVYGTSVVTVTKEVWANNADDALEKAAVELCGLTEYAGNGGWDKLVGVDGDDESVSASGDIEWDDTEELEDDPDRFECPNCGEECEGIDYGVWLCDECKAYYDDDGNEIDYEE